MLDLELQGTPEVSAAVNDSWLPSEPGTIRTPQEVADTNAELGIELARIALRNQELLKRLHGKEVFHVIKGEGYFNEMNKAMAHRTAKLNKPFIVCQWRTKSPANGAVGDGD